MDKIEYKAAIEAILFAGAEPVPVSRLAEALELEENEVREYAEELMKEYAARKGGIQLCRLEDSYQFCSEPAFALQVRKAMDIRRNTPLSQAAMEVLAVVAYNQPVTKAFVEQVRGVDCGAVMQGLVAKELIEERGRLELPGRPLLYGTTPHFLLSFGMESLADLPPLPDNEEELPLGEQLTMGDVMAPEEENVADEEETVFNPADGVTE